MWPIVIAFQVAQAAPFAEVVEQLGAWELRRGPSFCFIESRSSTGTHVALRADSTGNNFFILTNPAWRSLRDGRERITLRFRGIQRDDVFAPIEGDAISGQLATTSGNTGMLIFSVGRSSLDSLIAATSGTMRMAFSRGEIVLTDWMFIRPEFYRRLRACIDDPFSG